MLGSSPGSAVFGRDMLFDIPYLTDWADIGKRRQEHVDKSTALENKSRLDWDHKVDSKVLIGKKYIIQCTQVYTNGTVRWYSTIGSSKRQVNCT